MKWKKTNGQYMDARDNEATEEYLTSLGYEKIGSDAPEVGEPEQEGAHDSFNPADPDAETVEISEADMPDNLPMSDPKGD